ncbi:hypothetical protein Dxin01_00157 [Deinococcus xinjiangensis]|uniref:PD-(D/E)XK endonuclease-like domain-containing protein n=1 Tax=Deinococcus xinjiangensis TaxID=457454 RepID=A0ABP9V724_9DEIO
MSSFTPPINPPARLSVSALRQFNECGHLFKLARIDKVPEDRQAHHMWAGSVVHNAFMLAYGKPYQKPGEKRTCWEVDNAGDLQDALDLFDMLWDGEMKVTGLEDDLGFSRAQAAFEVLKSDPQLAPVPANKFAYGRLKALKAPNHEERRAAHKEYFKTMLEHSLRMGLAYPVVALEQEVKYELGGVPMLGYIDIVLKDEHGQLIYVDLKTGSTCPSDKDLAFDDQMNAYYTCEIEDQLPSEVWYHHMKSGTIMVTPKNLPMIEAMHETAPKVMQQIQEGRFVKNISKDCASCSRRLACMGV